MTLISQLVRAPCVACHHDTLIVAGQCQECQTVQPYAVGVHKAPADVKRSEHAKRREEMRRRVRNANTVRNGVESGLTGREHDIVALAAQGMRNRDIARLLGINKNSVCDFMRRARARLGLHSRGQLVEWAQRHGLQRRELVAA
jgi:DNA-binding CsgD family transcriptional regulator